MKAKTKFIKMFKKLPKKAQTELIFDSYGDRPMTLLICYIEILHSTRLGKEILSKLGYEDS